MLITKTQMAKAEINEFLTSYEINNIIKDGKVVLNCIGCLCMSDA